MKKLFFGFLLLAFAVGSKAQTISFTLTTAPCNHNGILTANITGLTPPLTVYYYTQGALATVITHTGVSGLTDALTSFSGGAITAIATDASGSTSMGSFAGAPPFTYSIATSGAVCPALGSASVTVTGGAAPYTYQWHDLSTMLLVGTTNPISLPAGNFGVTITDAAGCVFGSMDDTGKAKVDTISSFTVIPATTTANCTNGTASVSVTSGAVFPLSYAWSTGATTPSIIGLVTGFYNVTVMDAIGCYATASAYVPQSIPITAPVTPSPATCTAADGAVIAFGAGGTPPYSYVWSNGATTQSQSGLGSGFYRVYVTDANGCIGVDGGFVGTSTPITVTYSTTPTLCTSPTGTATVIISGGTPPYSTMWYTTPAQTGISAVGLAQGNFAFRITDALGCVQTGTTTVPPTNVITAGFTATPSICTLSTGSMTAIPVGGALPYSYAWSNGATTATMSGVATGTYHVTITDVMGCKATYSQYLPFNSTLGVGLVSTPATCVFVNDGTLTATPSGGTAPYSYSWTGGGSTGTIIGLPSGIPYWVKVTDALGCSVVDSTTLGADTASICYCTIEGNVYNDFDGNCNQDPGEYGLPNVKINISGRGYTFTDAAGHYSFKVPSGTYTVSENVLAYYPLSACQLNNISVTSIAGSGCVIPVNFANAVATIHDLHIATWDVNQPVPGHTYSQIVTIKNNGTVPEADVYSGYKPDGQLFAPITVVPSGYYNGSSYWYNTVDSFPLVNPGGSKTFLMTYNVPTNIPMGTSVLFKDTVTTDTPVIANWMADYSPWDNTRYFTTTVVSSFDPNFKEVYPKGTGSAGIITTNDTVLEYMVHFQNEGTYQAENIRVVDTLDDNFDWTTLTPLTMSHNCQVTVNPSGARKVATFQFNNINLPPMSTEPVASNGMLSYSIKMRPGLALGTQFKNSASIYFDYNAPVKTNQTLNTLGSVLSSPITVAAVTANSFTIYPNPAGNTFNAIINSDIAGAADMSINDVTGKTLINRNVTVQKGAQTLSVDISRFAPGVYFVNFTQNGKMQTQKLVVVKS